MLYHRSYTNTNIFIKTMVAINSCFYGISKFPIIEFPIALISSLILPLHAVPVMNRLASFISVPTNVIIFFLEISFY